VLNSGAENRTWRDIRGHRARIRPSLNAVLKSRQQSRPAASAQVLACRRRNGVGVGIAKRSLVGYSNVRRAAGASH